MKLDFEPGAVEERMRVANQEWAQFVRFSIIFIAASVTAVVAGIAIIWWNWGQS